MSDGLRETADYRIFEKRYTFKLLLSFYTSPLSDHTSQVYSENNVNTTWNNTYLLNVWDSFTIMEMAKLKKNCNSWMLAKVLATVGNGRNKVGNLHFPGMEV